MEGRITDGRGAPFAGACVSLNDGTVVDGTSYTDRTDEQGQYAIRARAASYRLIVGDCWGFAGEPRERKVRLRPGQRLVINGSLASPHGYVTGRVMDGARPVQACLELHDESGEQIPGPPCFGCSRNSDDEGRFTLRFEKRTTFAIKVLVDGCSRTAEWYRDASSFADAKKVTVEPDERIALSIDVAG